MKSKILLNLLLSTGICFSLLLLTMILLLFNDQDEKLKSHFEFAVKQGMVQSRTFYLKRIMKASPVCDILFSHEGQDSLTERIIKCKEGNAFYRTVKSVGGKIYYTVKVSYLLRLVSLSFFLAISMNVVFFLILTVYRNKRDRDFFKNHFKDIFNISIDKNDFKMEEFGAFGSTDNVHGFNLMKNKIFKVMLFNTEVKKSIHDLASPIAVLTSKPDETIFNEALKRLLQICKDMRYTALEVQSTITNLNYQIETCLKLLSYNAEICFPCQEIWINGSSGNLFKIFSNLFKNSMRYGLEPSLIISVNETEKRCIVIYKSEKIEFKKVLIESVEDFSQQLGEGIIIENIKKINGTIAFESNNKYFCAKIEIPIANYGNTFLTKLNEAASSSLKRSNDIPLRLVNMYE